MTIAVEAPVELPFVVDESVLKQVSEFLQDQSSSEMGPPDFPAPTPIPAPIAL